MLRREPTMTYPKKRYPSPPSTPLEAFLRKHNVKPAHLAHVSGYSRQHLLRIRTGRMEPTRRCIAAIVSACRQLARVKVAATELFKLDEDPPGEE
jgi:hypothetical protein